MSDIKLRSIGSSRRHGSGWSRIVMPAEPPPFIEPDKKKPLFMPKEIAHDPDDFELDGLGPLPPKPKTKKEIEMEEIRKKLAYLHWKKVENETAIREILDTSRRMEERDMLLRLSSSMSTTQEKALRLKSIIREEAKKPLTLAEPFLADFQRQVENSEEQDLQRTTRYLDHVHKIQKRGQEHTLVAATRFPPCEVAHAQDLEDEASLKALEQQLSTSLRILSSKGSHSTPSTTTTR